MNKNNDNNDDNKNYNNDSDNANGKRMCDFITVCYTNTFTHI